MQHSNYEQYIQHSSQYAKPGNPTKFAPAETDIQSNNKGKHLQNLT
jgi:hypothetical protein